MALLPIDHFHINTRKPTLVPPLGLAGLALQRLAGAKALDRDDAVGGQADVKQYVLARFGPTGGKKTVSPVVTTDPGMSNNDDRMVSIRQEIDTKCLESIFLAVDKGRPTLEPIGFGVGAPIFTLKVRKETQCNS